MKDALVIVANPPFPYRVEIKNVAEGLEHIWYYVGDTEDCFEYYLRNILKDVISPDDMLLEMEENGRTEIWLRREEDITILKILLAGRPDG